MSPFHISNKFAKLLENGTMLSMWSRSKMNSHLFPRDLVEMGISFDHADRSGFLPPGSTMPGGFNDLAML